MTTLWGYQSRPHASETPKLDLDGEWFPEQRAFYDDDAQLVAAIKGRRAGGTRAGCAHFIRQALAIPSARLLYLNSTRGEAERLAWYGNRDDGMAALCDRWKIPVKKDQGKLTLHFTDNDSWIYLRGADDEAELRKALGGAYHEVWWDEAQKIPPKLGPSIREVLLPALLDFGGRLRFVGTPVRQMSGLFWDVTRPELEKRLDGWSVHHWTLLDNPFFGVTRDERHKRGVLGLQRLLGGPDLDSPIMQREAFGRWVREDAAYVYYVHKRTDVLYAPHRRRDDGFPDIAAALKDLPWRWQEGFYALGVDIGYSPDPFAFALVGWHPHDPVLYEVASWKQTHLTSDDQARVMREIREQIPLGFIVADAGGPAKPTVAGWSQQFVERYGLPVLEAEKHNKHDAIGTTNTDVVAGNIRLRDGGAVYEDMSTLQWSQLVNGSGKLVEDPTMSNHASDAMLYAHRHARQYRHSAAPVVHKRGSREYYEQQQRELEEELLA